MAILLVKFGKLVEVIVIDAVAPFDRIELLTSGSEVETLFQPHVSLGCTSSSNDREILLL